MCAFRMFRRYRLFDNNGRIFEPYPFRCNYSNAEGDNVFRAQPLRQERRVPCRHRLKKFLLTRCHAKRNRPRKSHRPRRLKNNLQRSLSRELQLLRQCGSKAVCITRIVKQRAMLGPHLYIEGILDIEVNLIGMVMESLVSGARRSTISCC